MSFSYTPFSTDTDRVRFHLGDTDEASAILQDEEIAAIITEAGGWREAVIACIRYIIAKMTAIPNFTADWLKVDTAQAIASYRKMLADKQAELGVSDGSIGTDAVHVYRYDSDQTEPPDYQP